MAVVLLASSGIGCEEPPPATPLAAKPAPRAEASQAVAQPTPPSLRLPGDVLPERYSVRLTLHPDQPEVAGRVDVDVALRAPVPVLWLNGTDLTVTSATFESGGSSRPLRVVPGGTDFIGFASDAPLPAGSGKLHIEYRGKISRQDDRGIFAQREGGKWYALTQFESIYARRAFPCFDEPGFKTPWQITLEVPSDLPAFSNTPVASEASSETEKGMKVVTFAPTKPLPSYLVAFAVGPFEVVDAGRAGKNKTHVRIVVPSGKGARASWAVQSSGPILGVLEDYFGMPYPYEKLDVLSIPLTTSFGAMENPGLVTFAQRLLVPSESGESIAFRRRYASIAAHEFAHQWFGDYVTTAWWNDIWLNEAFATWLERKVIDTWKPGWNLGTEVVFARQRAMREDSLSSARRIRQGIESKDDIFNAFDSITYQKGSLVLSTAENFVGEERFRAGVRRYMKEHAHANATAEDFIGAISAEAGRDVSVVFGPYLEQTGVPLVKAELACAAGKPPTIALTQEPYVPLGGPESKSRWAVPVCARSAAGANDKPACTLLDHASGSTSLALSGACPTLLGLDAGGLGYYRTLPAGELTTKAVEAGLRKLPLPDALTALDDMAAAAAAGKASWADILRVASGLASDRRRPMTEMLVTILTPVRARFVGDSVRPAWAKWTRTHFGGRARALGFTPRAGESEDDAMLRPLLLGLVADHGEDTELRASARKAAERWLRDRKAVPPDLVETVLESAAYGGDRALFDAYVAEAKKTEDRSDRTSLLEALGQFRDPALLNDAFALVVNEPKLDPREAFEAVMAAARSDWGPSRDAAFRFIQEHYDALHRRLPVDLMARLPLLVSGYCDAQHREEISRVFGPHAAKLPGGPRTLAKALERIQLCAAEAQVHTKDVSAYLQKP